MLGFEFWTLAPSILASFIWLYFGRCAGCMLMAEILMREFYQCVCMCVCGFECDRLCNVIRWRPLSTPGAVDASCLSLWLSEIVHTPAYRLLSVHTHAHAHTNAWVFLSRRHTEGHKSKEWWCAQTHTPRHTLIIEFNPYLKQRHASVRVAQRCGRRNQTTAQIIHFHKNTQTTGWGRIKFNGKAASR